jgi:hypothetical protein
MVSLAAPQLGSPVLARAIGGVVEEPVAQCFYGGGGWWFGVEERLVEGELFVWLAWLDAVGCEGRAEWRTYGTPLTLPVSSLLILSFPSSLDLVE